MNGLWFLAGAALGFVSLGSQRWSILRLDLVPQAQGLLLVGAGMILRVLLAGGLLLLAVQQGLLPLLLAFGGMWLTRWALLIVANLRGE